MKRIIPIVVILAAIGGGYWWFTSRPSEAAQGSDALLGSGTIEAETVAVTAELGGRILELKVDEGEEVTAGQILVELEKADLLAQAVQLESAVETAKANLELASAAARPEDVAAARAELAQAEAARDGARLVWDRAKVLVDNPHELEARVNQGKARVTDAAKSLETAQVNLKRAEIQAEKASRNQSSHAALVANEAAQKQLQAAQIGVQIAEVALAGAQTQVEHLNRMRYMPLSLIAQANTAEAVYGQAEAAVLAAQANLNATQANPTAEDIAVAQAQLLEAEAASSAVEVQLAKQTLSAPRAGLVSQKLVNPGELAAPGAMLLELSDIETVDLTVYIPETQIGRVKIGQAAEVHVDAYSGELFEGVVTFIAHEAEFTPRNVQTQEERVNLVFAVKITLDNADHHLKPGMPADAEILPKMAVTRPASPPPSPTPTVLPTATPTPVSRTPTPKPTPTLSSAEIAPAEELEPASKAVGQAEVLSWGLKVRTGPGIAYADFAHLARGQVVPILSVDPATGWLEVELPSGDTGWITGSQTYVAVSK
jgi:multidrug resistance efflux pump